MVFKDLEKLVLLLKNSDVGEFEWEKNKEKLRIRMKGHGDTVAQVSYAPPPIAPVSAPVQDEQVVAHSSSTSSKSKSNSNEGKQIISPFVGTYYEAPSPGSPKYVEVGKTIKRGDVLCIIEAMKIMNEIEAEFDGTISEILVKNGDPVEYGQPLFVVS